MRSSTSRNVECERRQHRSARLTPAQAQLLHCAASLTRAWHLAAQCLRRPAGIVTGAVMGASVPKPIELAMLPDVICVASLPAVCMGIHAAILAHHICAMTSGSAEQQHRHSHAS